VKVIDHSCRWPRYKAAAAVITRHLLSFASRIAGDLLARSFRARIMRIGAPVGIGFGCCGFTYHYLSPGRDSDSLGAASCQFRDRAERFFREVPVSVAHKG
jgi:hypothetical protein